MISSLVRGRRQQRGRDTRTPRGSRRPGAELGGQVVEHDVLVRAEIGQALGALHPSDEAEPAFPGRAVLGDEPTGVTPGAVKTHSLEAVGDRECGRRIDRGLVGARDQNERRREDRREQRRARKRAHATRTATRWHALFK